MQDEGYKLCERLIENLTITSVEFEFTRKIVNKVTRTKLYTAVCELEKRYEHMEGAVNRMMPFLKRKMASILEGS